MIELVFPDSFARGARAQAAAGNAATRKIRGKSARDQARLNTSSDKGNAREAEAQQSGCRQKGNVHGSHFMVLL
jgi:hypothetical protein